MQKQTGPHNNPKKPVTRRTDNPVLAQAWEANTRIIANEFQSVHFQGIHAAYGAHIEIESRADHQKSSAFYQRYLPWRRNLAKVCIEGFRRYFKMALAHPAIIKELPGRWANNQIQPFIRSSMEAIADWMILACDGQNRYIRNIGQMELMENQTVSMPIPVTMPEFPPLKDWRAPAWLFVISQELTGIGPLKDSSVPQNNLNERLGAAHTRLILKGARRVFLGELRIGASRAMDDEIANHAIKYVPSFDSMISKKRTHRVGNKNKDKLWQTIRNILEKKPDLKGLEFCAELDKRHAQPLPAWIKSGEWKDCTFKSAWRKPGLKRKIRRVRQEALKNK